MRPATTALLALAACATAGAPPPPPADIVDGYVAVELVTEPNQLDTTRARRIVEAAGVPLGEDVHCAPKDCGLACLPVWCLAALRPPADAEATRAAVGRVAASTDDALVRVAVVCRDDDRSRGCEARMSSARPLPRSLVPRPPGRPDVD
jgi:hypothetical protein